MPIDGDRWLRGLAALVGDDKQKTATGAEWNVALGRDPGDFDAAVAALQLERAGYVAVEWSNQQHRPPAAVWITPEGIASLRDGRW